MKTRLALLLFAMVAEGVAAEPRVWSARVDVQIVAVAPKVALALVPDLQREQTADAAMAKVQSMIANSDAELLAWLTAMARSGDVAMSSAGEDVRSPGYEPQISSIPQSFPQAAIFPVRLSVPRHRGQHWGIRIPHYFEIQAAGPSMEFEPSVEETGERIALRLTVQLRDMPKWNEFVGARSSTGITGIIQQPEFQKRMFSGTLTVPHGKRMVLATFTENTPTPRVVLFLLRAVAFEAAE